MSEVILFLLLIGVVVSFLFIITSDRSPGNVEYSAAIGGNGRPLRGNNKISHLGELVKFKDVAEAPDIKGSKSLAPPTPIPPQRKTALASGLTTTNPPQVSKTKDRPVPETHRNGSQGILPTSPTKTKVLEEINPVGLGGTNAFDPRDPKDSVPPNVFSLENGLTNPIIPSEASVLPQVAFTNEPISPRGVKALQRGTKDKDGPTVPTLEGPIPIGPSSALTPRAPKDQSPQPINIEVEPLDLSALESLSATEQVHRILGYLQTAGTKDEANYQATLTQLQQLYQTQYQQLKQLEIQQENPSWDIEQVSKELEHERQQLGTVHEQLEFIKEEKQFLSRENSNLRLRLNKSEQAQINLENDLVKTQQRLNLIAIIATVVVASGLGVTLVLNQIGSTPNNSQDGEEPAALNR